MNVSFIEHTAFSRVRDDYFGDDEGYRLFQRVLQINPRVGVVIPGCSGVRKMRWTDPKRGKGKRGGIRVLYFYSEEFAILLLLTAYDKNIEDISQDQKKSLAVIVEEFRQQMVARRRKVS